MAQGRVTINLFSAMTWNPDLFGAINLPPGLDREMVEDAIVDRCAECALLYTDPEFLQSKNIAWFNRHYYNIQKLFDASMLKYDPLSDYSLGGNVTESEGETESGNVNNVSGETTTTESSGNSNANTETTVSAYNSNDYQPDNNVESRGSTSANSSSTMSREEDRNFNTDRNKKRITENDLEGMRTAPQDLLRKEYEIAVFNVYDRIAELWEVDFCYSVY